MLSLPEQAEMPDAVFVEDTALILDEVAILLRPGVGFPAGGGCLDGHRAPAAPRNAGA